MPIAATNPSILNETYDKWAFEFRTIGDGCTEYGSNTPIMPIRAMADMCKARVLPDGTWERSPLPRDRITVVIDDLVAEMTADPTGPIATAYSALVTAVQAFAESQGKL